MGVGNVSGQERAMGKSSGVYDAVFTDKTDNSTMDQSDFLKLIVAQMQNQDFMNPMDNNQMVEQMVQFSNMQQMQEMAGYARSNYAMSLVGKTVTASRFKVNGELDTTTGPVQRISLVDDEYVVYVGGKKYSMNQIMDVSNGVSSGVSLVTPTNYSVKTEDVDSSSATVKWEVPTEDEASATGLRYTVYYGKEGPFDTVEAVEAGTMAGPKEQKAVTSQSIDGLEAETGYYINVVVTDQNGEKSVYKPVTIKTKRQD